MRVKSNGRKRLSLEVPERSVVTSNESAPPDPEVLERAKRRRFTGEYKLQVLDETDACREPGEIAALLRREGLYSSHLTAWRRARREGALGALGNSVAPKDAGVIPWFGRTSSCVRRTPWLQQRLKQTEIILEIQKKASELLRIPLSRPEIGDDV